MSRRFHQKKGYEFRTDSFSVVVGAHWLRAREASQRRHQVHRIVVHEYYSTQTQRYDIMLVQLSTSIGFNDKIKPICVDHSVFSPGTSCIVTGWGHTSTTSRPTYDMLYFLYFLS